MKEILHFLIATGVAYSIGYLNAKNKYEEREWQAHAEMLVARCDGGLTRVSHNGAEGLEGWYQSTTAFCAYEKPGHAWDNPRGKYILNYIKERIEKRKKTQ